MPRPAALVHDLESILNSWTPVPGEAAGRVHSGLLRATYRGPVGGKPIVGRIWRRPQIQVTVNGGSLDAQHSHVSKRGAQCDHDGWCPAVEEVGLTHRASVQRAAD